MDVIIVCHTEFGFVNEKIVIFDKNATIGVSRGVTNLAGIADKYGAKVTFAVMPEVAKHFPTNIKHEIGLHIHPGWIEVHHKNFSWFVGDKYLKNHCTQSINSTVLRDYTYKEQLEIIKTGKAYLEDIFGVHVKVFVAGRWSINNDTVQALLKTGGITHGCSATTHAKTAHYDWSKLPRICMPYHPSKIDYQERGNLPLLIVPISKMFLLGNINPESIPLLGLSWLKAGFLEYYEQDLPLFHICLHSPCMIDRYFISAMDDLLRFISMRKNVKYKFASEIEEYDRVNPKTRFLPYLSAVNKKTLKTCLKIIAEKIYGDPS